MAAIFVIIPSTPYVNLLLRTETGKYGCSREYTSGTVCLYIRVRDITGKLVWNSKITSVKIL